MKTGSVAIAIVCKTPSPGASKTRLSPPLTQEECARLSACFIADLAATIGAVAESEGAAAYAVYTPAGSEAALQELLPRDFRLLLQVEGDFGLRLQQAAVDLLASGHCGVILVNSDSPTLPPDLLRAAVAQVRSRRQVVLGPALDGGYTLIGVSAHHPELFDGIPWSTPAVLERSLQQAAALGLPQVLLETWYDVDDAGSYLLLESELDGDRPTGVSVAYALHDAPRTRALVLSRRGTGTA